MSCLAEQAKILWTEVEGTNLDWNVKNEKWRRWDTCSMCEQKYHGVVACAMGWACWKTYAGRPEMDTARMMAMTRLGNGLSIADRHADALPVREAELAMYRRLGASEKDLLVTQSNLAITYGELGNMEKALSMERDVYSAKVKLLGKENEHTLLAASNYAISLNKLRRFKEAKALLRQTMPVARRVLGESDELTLKLRRNYALALYKGDGATLDDLSKAVTTLEETARIARRVLGDAHPTTYGIEDELQEARAALRARETPGSFQSEAPGSFQRASEEKLRTRRVVSVADRFRRPAGDK